MVIFIRDLGEKQYHAATDFSADPSYYSRKGWKKGQKYKNGNRIFLVDFVDVVKGGPDKGEVRLHVTKIK